MIYSNLSAEEAAAIPDPKHIWINGETIQVYTGEHIPVISSLRTIPAHEFRDRFTTQELAAMKAAELAGDVTAGLLLLNVQTADEGIPLDSQKVIDGLAYWVSIGVLAANRPAEIRA